MRNSTFPIPHSALSDYELRASLHGAVSPVRRFAGSLLPLATGYGLLATLLPLATGCWLLATLFFPAPASARLGLFDSWRLSRATDRGNQLFHQGKYDQARASYMKAKDLAGEKSPEGYRLHYNIGDTFYKEGNYEPAQKEFEQSLAGDDPGLREQSYYNLGNVYAQQGLAKNDIELLKKAVENYQKALELNPDNEDAKFNIEVIRRHLKAQPEKPNPQCQNPKPGDQAKNQQDQKDQQNQQGQPGQQNQQGQLAKNQDQKKDQEKSSDQKKSDQDQEKEKAKPAAAAEPSAGNTAEQKAKAAQETKTPAGSNQSPDKMKKEEAERFLQAVQEREEEDMKKAVQANQGPRGRKDQDW